MRRLAAIPLEDAWTQERAKRWWRAHVPDEVSRNGAETCAPTGEPGPAHAEVLGVAA